MTISAGGLSDSQKVTVLSGTVQRPCGTTPLLSRTTAASAAPAPPPAPAPAPVSPAPAPAPLPAPPPSLGVPAAPATPGAPPAANPPAPAPAFFLAPPNATPLVPIVPPPSGTAPVGATEDEEEDEEAYDLVSQMTARRYDPRPAAANAGGGGGGDLRLALPALMLVAAVAAAAGLRALARPPRPSQSCLPSPEHSQEVPMSSPTPSRLAQGGRDPLAYAALLVALLALVFSMGGEAPAKREAAAGNRGKGVGKKLGNLRVQCPISPAVNFGSWCLEASPHSIPATDVGKNDYFYAAQTCAREGGWLPQRRAADRGRPEGAATEHDRRRSRQLRGRRTAGPEPRDPRQARDER